MTDLTSLDPTDTADRVSALCERALCPNPGEPTLPMVAAVCVLPRLAAVAADRLRGSSVAVAAVAGTFPTGLASATQKAAEARAAVGDGATEIDLTLNHQAAARGDLSSISDEVTAVRAAIGGARLKTILETGALGDPALIREVAVLAAAAGADMLKTSTGKGPPGATPQAVEVLVRVAVEQTHRQGRTIGVKASGGIRTPEDAVTYLRIAEDVGGPGWADPERFRFGASSLLDAVVQALVAASA